MLIMNNYIEISSAGVQVIDATGPLLQGRCCRIGRWRDGLKTEEAGTEWWWWCGVVWWHWTPPRNLFLSPVIIPPSSVRLWRWCRTGLQTGVSLCGEYSTHSHQSPLLCTYLLTSTMGPFDRKKWIKVNKRRLRLILLYISVIDINPVRTGPIIKLNPVQLVSPVAPGLLASPNNLDIKMEFKKVKCFINILNYSILTTYLGFNLLEHLYRIYHIFLFPILQGQIWISMKSP